MSNNSQSSASLRTELSELFKNALSIAYPDASEAAIIAPCNNPKFGDYQCNNAMPLFGKMKGKEGCPKAPRDVANSIVASLPTNPLVKETSLAGPGFINVKVSREYLAARVGSIVTDGLDNFAPNMQGKKAVVDFSSPNVAKEMHVGHLRSTIIGDTICRVLEYCKADVLRLNHIGEQLAPCMHVIDGGTKAGAHATSKCMHVTCSLSMHVQACHSSMPGTNGSKMCMPTSL